MRRILSIFLILVILSDLSIHFYLFYYQKKSIKRAVKELILNNVPESELITKVYTIHELQNLDWVESKEYIINGEMYDLLKADTLGQYIKITSFIDIKEKNLISTFYKYIHDKYDDLRKNVKEIPKFIFDGYTSNYFSIESTNQINKKFSFNFPFKILSGVSQELFNPPKS